MEQFNNIFMDEIKEYIKKCMLDDVHDSDEFYDVLFESVAEHLNCFVIETELKKYNYLTIECVLEMCKSIKTTFGIEDLDLDYNYIMMSYAQFLVSENGADLYEYYKEECVNQRINNEQTMEFDECTICYEEKLLNTTVCNHKFCSQCLFKLRSCAMCRRQLVETFSDYPETSDDEN